MTKKPKMVFMKPDQYIPYKPHAKPKNKFEQNRFTGECVPTTPVLETIGVEGVKQIEELVKEMLVWKDRIFGNGSPLNALHWEIEFLNLEDPSYIYFCTAFDGFLDSQMESEDRLYYNSYPLVDPNKLPFDLSDIDDYYNYPIKHEDRLYNYFITRYSLDLEYSYRVEQFLADLKK